MFQTQRRWVALTCILPLSLAAVLAACGEGGDGTGSQASVQVAGQTTELLPDVATTQEGWLLPPVPGLTPEIWEAFTRPLTGLTYEEWQQVRRILGVRPDGGYRTGISGALMQGNRHLHVEGEPSVLESVSAEFLALNLTVSTVVTDGSPVTTAILISVPERQ